MLIGALNAMDRNWGFIRDKYFYKIALSLNTPFCPNHPSFANSMIIKAFDDYS